MFDQLLEATLLDVCMECGDGNEHNPIDLDGRCCRHGAWSHSAARAAFHQELDRAFHDWWQQEMHANIADYDRHYQGAKSFRDFLETSASRD